MTNKVVRSRPWAQTTLTPSKPPIAEKKPPSLGLPNNNQKPTYVITTPVSKYKSELQKIVPKKLAEIKKLTDLRKPTDSKKIVEFKKFAELKKTVEFKKPVDSKKPVESKKNNNNSVLLQQEVLKKVTTEKIKSLQSERQTSGSESDYSDSQNPKLEEICFVQNELGKRIIAKYRTKNNQKGKLEDNLIVAWDGIHKPQVVSYKVRGPGVYALINDIEPDQKNLFRVHDFTKWSPQRDVKKYSGKAKKKKNKTRDSDESAN